mgnify:CR=1 FL=1
MQTGVRDSGLLKQIGKRVSDCCVMHKTLNQEARVFHLQVAVQI